MEVELSEEAFGRKITANQEKTQSFCPISSYAFFSFSLISFICTDCFSWLPGLL